MERIERPRKIHFCKRHLFQSRKVSDPVARREVSRRNPAFGEHGVVSVDGAEVQSVVQNREGHVHGWFAGRREDQRLT